MELVPESMQAHPAARAHARRLGRPASKTLLDVSWHYAAMRGAPDAHKRGRPDIIHHAILAAVATPLYKDGLLRVYIHTIRDTVARLGEGVRIPKSYHRFEGLMAEILAGTGDGVLLEVYPSTLPALLNDIRPSAKIGLSRSGELTSCRRLATLMQDDLCVVVGGFQKGGFADSTTGSLDYIWSISPRSLETHLVVSRLLYDMETET